MDNTENKQPTLCTSGTASTAVSIPPSAQIIFVSDAFVEDFPYGGAELSSEALIESSPFEVFKLASKQVTAEHLASASDRFWIFGNFMNLDLALAPQIAARLKYSVIEYDYKYCYYRNPILHRQIASGECNCEGEVRAAVISSFLSGTTTTWWMSYQQMNRHLLLFPRLLATCNIVLSSVFTRSSLRLIQQLRREFSSSKRNVWIILGSPSWIKGYEDSEDWCESRGLDYEVIWGRPHLEVLRELAQAKGVVYLPRGYDTCPRMLIEAKLLGCRIITNTMVDHLSESWFCAEDPDVTSSYLYTVHERFWEQIAADMARSFPKKPFFAQLTTPDILEISSAAPAGLNPRVQRANIQQPAIDLPACSASSAQVNAESVPPLLVTSPLFDYSDPACLARGLVQKLNQAGVEVHVEISSADRRFLVEMRHNPLEASLYRLPLTREVSSGIAIWIASSEGDTSLMSAPSFAERSGFNHCAAITTLDGDCLPGEWISRLGAVDEVWVPSSFARDCFLQSGMPEKKVQILPLGVDHQVFNPDRTLAAELGEKRQFVFLSFLHWEMAKGWDILLRAYFHAFSAADDVCLVLGLYPPPYDVPDINQALLAIQSDLGKPPQELPLVIPLERYISPFELPTLYRAANCFILPARTEGWGLRYLEAMAMELPVIATRWGGHLDFLNEENSYLIDVERLAPMTGGSFGQTGTSSSSARWAEPSWEHTAALMRTVFTAPDQAAAKGRRAREDIKKRRRSVDTAKWILERSRVLEAAKQQAANKKDFISPFTAAPAAVPASRSLAKPGPAASPSIAIDAQTLLYAQSSPTGIALYTYYHLSTLAALAPEWQFILLMPQLQHNELIDRLLALKNVEHQAANGASSRQYDILHFPDALNISAEFALSLDFCSGLASTLSTTLHDSAPLAQTNDSLLSAAQMSYSAQARRLAASSAHFFAVSRAAADDALRYLQVPADRLSVISGGANKELADDMITAQLAEPVLNRYSLAQPFFVFVGSLAPQKNFLVALQAFLEASRRMPMQLAVIGPAEDPYRLSSKELAGDGRVQFIDYLPRPELECLYATAAGLLHPAASAGFSMQVLEAMSRGCPVLAADCAAIREITGDAAMLIPPQNVQHFAESMIQIITDTPLRERLIFAGLDQAKHFSWENTASETLAIWKRQLASIALS